MDIASEKTVPSEVAPESEEVLGSVTHSYEPQNNERPFAIQLRTSARVSKKLRLDSQVIPPPVQEKKELKAEEKEKPADKTNTVRRVHELWSPEDKNAFFEALNEYGKDFDSIRIYMDNKQQKRGIVHSTNKNRDKARHFYYRTWHKITKYLKFPQEVNKAVQELYGLINFGEFRKRVGTITDKNSAKLNELIYCGSTQVRIKGKTLRLKTPVCRALRKLNKLQEITEDFNLPTRISVELRPRNNESWCRVQSIAMNPRVRTVLTLNQQLATMIDFMERKWQFPDAKVRGEKNSILNETAKQESSENQDSSPILRLAPKQGVNIVAPSVRSGQFVTSSRISLLAYEEKYGSAKDAVQANLRQIQSVNRSGKHGKYVKKQVDEDRSRTISEGEQPQGSHSEQQPHCNYNEQPHCSQSEQPHCSQSEKDLDSDIVSSTVNQLLLLNSETDTTSKYGADESDWTSPAKEEFEPNTEISTSESDEQIVAKAKAGWNTKNAGLIRIGDLYLMFGNDSKIQLEYWWEDPNSNLEKSKANDGSLNLTSCNKISESLQKLISITKLCLKEKNSCLCGQACKNKIVHPRSRMVQKPMKSMHNNSPELAKASPGSTFNSDGSNNLSHVSPIPYMKPPGVSLFKEQLDMLQSKPGNRRRIGDKQRPLTSIPKVMVQLIKPKEDDDSTDTSIKESKPENTVSGMSTSSSNTPHPFNGLNADPFAIRDANQALSSFRNYVPNGMESNVLADLSMDEDDAKSDCSSLTRLLNEAISDNLSCTNRNVTDMMLEEDTASSCSTITRLLKESLPAVIPQSKNPSSDGLTTPVVMRKGGSSVVMNENGRQSPTWSVSQDSDFSIGRLINEITATSEPMIIQDEETPISVDTQFQSLMNESSVDYTEKFANLAAQIAAQSSDGNM